MKRVLSIAFACMMLLSVVAVPASASAAQTGSFGASQVGTMSTSDDGTETEMSDVMTFDEMVATIEVETGVSHEEAVEIVAGPGGIEANPTAQTSTYRKFSEIMTITPDYEVIVNFFCETSESGHFVGVVSVIHSSMNRIYVNDEGKDVVKEFEGTLYVYLKDANTIKYTINGTFYNDGNTLKSGGEPIVVGESATYYYDCQNKGTVYVEDSSYHGIANVPY